MIKSPRRKPEMAPAIADNDIFDQDTFLVYLA
jgi:hypothetical protein